MDFSQVKAITIPEGNVIRILSGATVLWERTGLPAEYQEVEYIESTGTQYIDTGIASTRYITAHLDMQFTEQSSSTMIIIAWSTGAGRWFGKGSYNTYSAGNDAVSNIDALLRKEIDVFFTSSTTGFTIDGVTYSKAVTSSKSNGYTMFAGRNASTGVVSFYASAKLYKATIQENGETIRDLVPCYRKIDKKPGLYDMTNGVFYTNAGTGEFNVGADVIVLPAEYQRVEYIRNTDDGGQWIDTGVLGENSNLRIDISYMWDVVPPGGSYQNIISAYINETSNCTRIIQYGAGTTYVDVNIRANRSVAYRGTRVAGTKYNESLTRTYYDVNGERLVLTETVTGSSNNHNLHLFSSSTHSAFAKSLRLYNCKLYDGNTIVRDFVPCYRKIDKVAGLYDVVNGVFYTNAGTGEFNVGADV